MCDFRYVTTHDNPGDIAWRGMSTNEWQNASHGGMDETDWTKTKKGPLEISGK